MTKQQLLNSTAPQISTTIHSAAGADPQLQALQHILGQAAQALAVINSSALSLEVDGPGGDRMLSRAETARVLHTSVDTLDRMRARGEGPPWAQTSARNITYRLSGLRRYIAEREGGGAA